MVYVACGPDSVVDSSYPEYDGASRLTNNAVELTALNRALQ